MLQKASWQQEKELQKLFKLKQMVSVCVGLGCFSSKVRKPAMGISMGGTFPAIARFQDSNFSHEAVKMVFNSTLNVRSCTFQDSNFNPVPPMYQLRCPGSLRSLYTVHQLFCCCYMYYEMFHFFSFCHSKLQLVHKSPIKEKIKPPKKKKKERGKQDKASFCEAVRSILISQLLPNSKRIYLFAYIYILYKSLLSTI